MPRFTRALIVAAVGRAAVWIGVYNQNDGAQDWHI
jgi:hypothetical protein